jgi:hypothetical protein
VALSRLSRQPHNFGVNCFGMGVPPDIKIRSRDTAMEFLRTELSVALLFASLADGQRKSGDHDAATRSVADAEQGYLALLTFLSEPTSVKFMNVEEQADFASALKRLRKKLDLMA